MDNFGSVDLRAKKNCLLVFRNKKINNFDAAINVINSFSAIGYYFDKISYVSYNSSEEIVRAIKDGKNNYENLLIYCPCEMQSTLKTFLNNLYSSEFNELGILKCENSTVFMLFCDADNRLNFDDIKNILDGKYGVKYDREFIKTVGASCSEINAAIAKAKNVCPEIDFNVRSSYGDCKIEVLYSSDTPKMQHESAVRTVLDCLKEYVYAIEDVTLPERLYDLLKLRRMKISIAESFTGGGIGKKLVEVPGISEVYFEGLNTYANEAKKSRLGVSDFSINHYGAVSEQVAREMAAGLINTGKCDVAIATTGIAGPKSDNSLKPAGLCYIAVGTYEHINVYEYKLKGNRETVTKTAINLALFLAYKILK